MNDWEGHGEFVARVAGGTDYSVAKNAGLYVRQIVTTFFQSFGESSSKAVSYELCLELDS